MAKLICCESKIRSVNGLFVVSSSDYSCIAIHGDFILCELGFGNTLLSGALWVDGLGRKLNRTTGWPGCSRLQIEKDWC